MPQYELTMLHNYTSGHDKAYMVRIDGIPGAAKPYRVVAAWGAMGRPRVQAEQAKGDFESISDARRLCRDLAANKESGGYVNIDSGDYFRHARANEVAIIMMGMIDMSRCLVVGQGVPDPITPQQIVTAVNKVQAASRKPRQAAAPASTHSRSRRVVTL